MKILWEVIIHGRIKYEKHWEIVLKEELKVSIITMIMSNKSWVKITGVGLDFITRIQILSIAD